jgi:hypothetical protein
VVSKGGSESRDQPTWWNHQFIESVAICSNNPGPLQVSATRLTWNRGRDLDWNVARVRFPPLARIWVRRCASSPRGYGCRPRTSPRPSWPRSARLRIRPNPQQRLAVIRDGACGWLPRLVSCIQRHKGVRPRRNARPSSKRRAVQCPPPPVPAPTRARVGVPTESAVCLGARRPAMDWSRRKRCASFSRSADSCPERS